MIERIGVRHPVYGHGVVVDSDPRRGVNVDFGYVTAWMPLAELHVPDGVEVSFETPSTQPPTTARTPTPSLSTDIVAARRAVVALKLGQVLEENVIELSIGIDDIRAELNQAIVAAAGRQPQSILVEGSWGAGKTHLLTLLTRLAAERELATATVILDGEGVSLSEPMGLMEAVLGSLRYPGEMLPSGVGKRLAELRRHHGSKGMWQTVGWRLANAIEQIPRGALDEPEVMEVIEDYFMLTLPPSRAKEKLRQYHYRIGLPPLKAQRLDERAERFCDLLQGWAGFCSLTGAKGLAVVFDEVDVEYATRSTGLRSALLKAFSGLLRKNCPILLAFGSAPASAEVGDEDDAVEDLVRLIKGIKRIEAPQPNVAQTKELGVRLTELYTRAYPRPTSAVALDGVRRRIVRFAEQYHDENLVPTPRGFVRGILELMDVTSEPAEERTESVL